MIGEKMMHDLKKLFSLLIVTMMIFSLASCAGIGDGALIGSPILSDDGAYGASLTFFDASGNEESTFFIRNNEEAKALYRDFTEGEYVSGVPRLAIEMAYVEVSFNQRTNIPEDSASLGKYRVYSDSCVFEETASGLVEKGRLDGINEKLMNYINLEDSNVLYIESGLTSLHYCDIKSYGLRNEVNLKFENAELWQIACYRGRADFSSEGDAKKGEGAYFVINYYSMDRVDSTICIYENDVVVIVKRGVNISVLSTKVDGYREGIFAEIERYLEGK